MLLLPISFLKPEKKKQENNMDEWCEEWVETVSDEGFRPCEHSRLEAPKRPSPQCNKSVNTASTEDTMSLSTQSGTSMLQSFDHNNSVLSYNTTRNHNRIMGKGTPPSLSAKSSERSRTNMVGDNAGDSSITSRRSWHGGTRYLDDDDQDDEDSMFTPVFLESEDVRCKFRESIMDFGMRSFGTLDSEPSSLCSKRRTVLLEKSSKNFPENASLFDSSFNLNEEKEASTVNSRESLPLPVDSTATEDAFKTSPLQKSKRPRSPGIMKLEVSTRRFDRSSPKSTKPAFQFPPQSKSEPRNSFQASMSFEKLLSEEGTLEPKMNGLIDLSSMIEEEHEILFETVDDMEEETSTRETSSSTDSKSLEKRTDQSDVTYSDQNKTTLLHGMKKSDHAQTKSVKKENGKYIPPGKLLQKEKMQRFVSCNEKSAGGHDNHWSSSLDGKTLRRTTLSASSSPSFMSKNPSDKAECLTSPTSANCRDVCGLSACEDGQASLSCPSKHKKSTMKSSSVQWPEWGYESDPCLPPGFMSQLSDALPSRKTNKNTTNKTNEKTLAKVLTSKDEEDSSPNSSSNGEKEGRTPAWKKRIQWQSSRSKSAHAPGRTGKTEKESLHKYIAVFKCDKLKGPAIFSSLDDADEYIEKDKNEREPAEWRIFGTFKEAETYLERRKVTLMGDVSS